MIFKQTCHCSNSVKAKFSDCMLLQNQVSLTVTIKQCIQVQAALGCSLETYPGRYFQPKRQ